MRRSAISRARLESTSLRSTSRRRVLLLRALEHRERERSATSKTQPRKSRCSWVRDWCEGDAHRDANGGGAGHCLGFPGARPTTHSASLQRGQQFRRKTRCLHVASERARSCGPGKAHSVKLWYEVPKCAKGMRHSSRHSRNTPWHCLNG